MDRRQSSVSVIFGLGLVAGLLALCLRLMVPVGWMPVMTTGGVTYVLCSGSGDQRMTTGVAGKGADKAADTAIDGGTCTFAGMGTPALADVPPSGALQIFYLFLALGLASTALPRRRGPSWLRPPLARPGWTPPAALAGSRSRRRWTRPCGPGRRPRSSMSTTAGGAAH